MKKLLIIRSVSFQQLDLNLPAIEKRYNDYDISILTHEHGVKLAEKYRNIKEIYVYPYKSGFKRGKKVKEFENIKFDVVIVPVTNMHGNGFFNVLKYALSINNDKIVICNVVSEFKEISKFFIYKKEMLSLGFRIVAITCTFITGLFCSPYLLIKLGLNKNSSKEKRI